MEENQDMNLEQQEEQQEQETKTYSQEEVFAMLQKESDRRVQQALKKQKKEYEKKLSLSQLAPSDLRTQHRNAEQQEIWMCVLRILLILAKMQKMHRKRLRHWIHSLKRQ